MYKKVAIHNGFDVRIVEVKETPKMLIMPDGVRFKKYNNPTPDCIGELLSNGSGLNGYTISEVDSEVVKKKIEWNKNKGDTQRFVEAIRKKYSYNPWRPSEMEHITLEQIKHINEYLSLGMEIEE